MGRVILAYCLRRSWLSALSSNEAIISSNAEFILLWLFALGADRHGLVLTGSVPALYLALTS